MAPGDIKASKCTSIFCSCFKNSIIRDNNFIVCIILNITKGKMYFYVILFCSICCQGRGR